MTVMFKTPAERKQHYFGEMDSAFALMPIGSKMTRKDVGIASRKKTDSMGIFNATIPGYDTSLIMEEYAKVRGFTYTFKLSKTGKRLQSTVTKI
jgi:hypothetical protein